MFKKLQNLSLETKKKIAIFIAGSITFVIFAGWIVYISGTFTKALDTTVNQSEGAYSFVEKNVEKAYNAFYEFKSALVNATSTVSSSTEMLQKGEATSTKEVMASTTEIKNSEK